MLSSKNLTIGSIVTAQISITDRWVEIIDMLRDEAVEGSSSGEIYYHYPKKNQEELREKAYDWCFIVTSLYPKFMRVGHFNQNLTHYPHHLIWKGIMFNNYYGGFRLKYQDAKLPSHLRCLECHNYCWQTCTKDLRFDDFSR